MGFSRKGAGQNLTPQQARKDLAPKVLAILEGKAVPIFPQTSIAAPSPLVRIHLLPGMVGSLAGYPYIVGGKQWDVAVVPVLEDPLWEQPAFKNQKESVKISQLGAALEQSFRENGYGP